MNAERCTCLSFCVCFLLASMVTAISDADKERATQKCWSIRKTTFRLCIENNENLASRTNPSLEQQIHKRYADNSFPSSRIFRLPALYNRHQLTNNDGMIVPFFMKRRLNRRTDLNGSSFPSKMADITKESSVVNKRPFDSISYNAGFGGFK